MLTGERGEYDVAGGNLTGAQSMLQTMASAAGAGDQISEQVWGGSTGTGRFCASASRTTRSAPR